jgi:hypothetical protein
MAKSRWRFQKETRATKITGSKRYEKQKCNYLKNQTVIELAGIANVPLKPQKRRALREKHRKSSHPRIFHGITDI